MRFNASKKKGIAIFLGIMILFSLNIFLFEQFIIPNNNSKDLDNTQFIEENPTIPRKEVSISNDTYDGIGSAWDITHYANRTDKNIPISISNNDYDNSAKVPLGKNWYGQNLSANIYELYDYQNWNNGTFNFGPDDNDDSADDDDSSYTSGNIYQNWTFHKVDGGNYTNLMSGNYFHESYGPTDNHDCLELRMDGQQTTSDPTNTYGYNEGDKAYWSTHLSVPRGKIYFGILEFEAKVGQTININSWELKAYINNQKVYSISNYILEQFLSNSWGKISIPMNVWSNSSNVFQNPAYQDQIQLNISLEYTSGTTWYRGFQDKEYQQIFFDNVNLSLEAEAKPSQLNLRMNNTIVDDIDYGRGEVEIQNENWDGNIFSEVRANFSSFGTGKFGDYSLDFTSDLNLFAFKNSPDSNYELDTSSIGTKFSAINDSFVEWTAYGFINVPTGYEETKMKIKFPEDLDILWISEAAQPSINLTESCDTSNSGSIHIPVSQLTDSPEGFWTFEGISPNYAEGLNFYNDVTGLWILNSTYLSGDSVNITAKIAKNSLVENYIDDTKAKLQIIFPNGSLWEDLTQYKPLNSEGVVRFDTFSIPETGPNYLEGQYKAIVTWNNSYSTFDINETGIIVKNFRVVHRSVLTPEKVFFDNQLEGSVINLRVSYNDLVNDKAIPDAVVYTYNFTDPSTPLIFSEVNPGEYFLEYNFIGAEAGNNTITIYANSSDYLNINAQIKIEVIKDTIITVEDDFLESVPFKSNFSIEFSYNEKYFGDGIAANNLSTDWKGEHTFYNLGEGNYRLICKASEVFYEPNNLYSLILTVRAENYVSQSIPIRIYISDLESSLMIEINGTVVGEDDMVSYEFKEKINVSVSYTGDLQNHISGAQVRLVGASQSIKLTENATTKRYEKILNASDIGLGVHYFTIFANSSDFNPKSFRFIIEVTEWQTDLEILLNGQDKTEDPLIDIPIGKTLNLTVKYTTINDIHIGNANLRLSGDIQANLTENKDLEHYYILIETSDLGVGAKIFTVSAEKESYITLTSDIRVNVRKIKAEISTEKEEEQFNIAPGADFVIRISLEDLDFNSSIENASLRYSWEFGEGVLTDPNNDGVYVLRLNNVPEGSYTITITAFAGENYEFESYQITLNAALDPEIFTLLQTMIIIASIASIAIGGYLYTYQKILKYPKSVRKVRKFRKTLTKEKDPDISVESRKDAFEKVYQEELKEKLKKPSGGLATKGTVSKKIEKEKIELEEAVNETEKSSKETD